MDLDLVKEIAVRAGKFHVSASSEKSEVADRISLMRKSADILSSGWISTGPVIPLLKTHTKLGSVEGDSNANERRLPLHAQERRSRKWLQPRS